MPVDDLSRSDVVTAGPDTPVSELAATMDEETVGSIVITNDESPVGIVTDRDLAVRVLGANADPTEQAAEDVMTDDLHTCAPGDGFYEVVNTMAEYGVRRIPLCEGDTLTGIVTADDLTELLADEQQQFAKVIRAQRPSY